MAKLSANGQKVHYYLVKENSAPTSTLISWERETIAVMDSGKVLVKRDVIFCPAVGQPKPKRHSYGWKVAYSTKLPTHAERVAYGIEKMLKGGWKTVAA